MKGMSKEGAESQQPQQSYFYVVWPEDKSPGGTSSAVAATVSTANSAVLTSTPSLSTSLPTFNYEPQTLTTSSSGSSSSSLQQESPVGSPLSKETVSMASVQVMSSNTASPSHDVCTKLPSDATSMPAHSVQHLAPAVASTVGASSTFVIPSLDSFIPTSSVGRPRSMLTPDQTSSAKLRFHPVNFALDSNLKEIGTLAKQAIINLQKIVLATGSTGLGPGTGSVATPATTNSGRDAPASKRRRVWHTQDQSSQEGCMECEVKDAEINILRKRIQTMQEQTDQVVLPNGNGAVQSHVPPPPEDITPHIKPVVGHITEQAPQLEHQILLHHHHHQQQQGGKASKSASIMLSSDEPPEQSSSSASVTKQSGDYVELVTGSGVYIPAYKLEEATRDAKTGTQLARKLMDAFWDKDTLAKSTLTPRSKFQYQQLDPKVIKSIEAYCLSHDSTLHSKDIHATMTDKCCQARSRYRSLNPHIYNSE